MGTIFVQELAGGLDTRRMPEATTGGVLIRARDGHITRGGEFEQRAAFVPEYSLPAGTVGLFYDPSSIVIFGGGPEPSGLPVGVAYQQLGHPDIVRVLSADLYAGKIYAVAETADGGVFHFYDGALVTDWFDGRARATFAVTSGSTAPAVSATGSFEVTGGTSDPGNEITAITIDGVDILGSAVGHTGDNVATAAAIVAQINTHTSFPDYTAAATGQTVKITAVAPGSAPNGKAVIPSADGDVTFGSVAAMAGGVGAETSRLADLKIGGVSVIAGPVDWRTSNEATATALASAINSFASSPDYTASAIGNSVSVAAAATGTESNGYTVTFTVENGFTVSPTALALADGADSSDAYQPGRFVKTIGQKVYSVSGPNMHFSGIKDPTTWTTDAVGAGFVDMSTENSGSEELKALARYQNFIAVFAERVVQIWYTDPDPALNRQSQVLNNTGTGSPHSVTAFGDTDLFYLDESGLRSLRARDSSNAAATTDIGVPVDDLITQTLEELDDNERQQITGLIEPSYGRFWLIMRDRIFVFSFFNGAKVSAWTEYTATCQESETGAPVPFEVDAATVFKRRVYLRSGNTIYVYGGLATGKKYDATVAEAWLPYLDADAPTRMKQLRGVDLALRGLWEVAAAMDPTNESAEDKIGVFDETTYNMGTVPFSHTSTHVSLRFRSKGVGPHRLGACVIHFDRHNDED